MKTHPENLIMLSESKTHKIDMRRLFRKGERVRSKIDGKVMEVLKYIKNNFVEVKWFDIESKEIRINKIKEDKLSKAA
jgi:uncharacterized protein YodC (DUF2158 family)